MGASGEPGASLIEITRGTVEKALFSITCTTCQARLVVRNEEAVGDISECPKCGSFVHVTPPNGWKPGQDSRQQPEGESATDGSRDAESADAESADAKPADAKPADARSPTSTSPAETPSSSVKATAAPMASPGTSPPGRLAASPAELRSRRWVLLGALPVACLVLVLGAWSMFFASRAPELPPEPVAEKPVEATVVEGPAEPAAEPDERTDRFDRRWIPEGTTLFVSLGPGKLARQPASGPLIAQADPLRSRTIRPLLRSLGLKLDSIERLTWASTDLAAWSDRSVVVISLQAGHDASVLTAMGEAIELNLEGAHCRRLSGAAWSHPFAVIDERTIVTGDLALLRHLADRGEVNLRSSTIERLLKDFTPDADATLLLDLAAARAAGWKLPNTLFDAWSAGKDAWHTAWEIPVGLACTLRYASPLHSRLALVCESETAAEKVSAAMGELISAGRQSLAAQAESIGEDLRLGKLTAATAGQYELLLSECRSVLGGTQSQASGELAWVRADFSLGPTELANLVIESRSAVAARWLAAALAADESNHRRLVTALTGYQKSEGHFPDAAQGSALLAPETRLSWIATMLPYYARGDWHRQLEFGYSWNNPQNRSVTRQPLPEVVNPTLGPAKTEAGFPVTHYVGVAGVGPDAGRLKAADPRAGVFGYGRTTRAEDITDGAANTIALLGASADTGAWAAGGQATVRPLTETPYVNGPDGFGSGQPDGMLAGMADGAVRFISKDIDPRVFEQLATINGGDRAAIAALHPQPEDPEPATGQPGEDPNEPDGDGQPEDGQPEDGQPEEVLPEHLAARPPIEPIDVRARLAQQIPEIDLRDVPLAEAVELVAAVGMVPISFDPEAMQQLAVTPRDPITVQLSGATLYEILESAATKRGLLPTIDAGQVLLSSPPQQREQLRKMRYTISDLTLSDAAAAAALATTVEKLVAPDSWRSNGGRGTLQSDAAALTATQTGPVHFRLLVFCEKLRNARGKTLRSRGNHERFDLATRHHRAKDLLDRPITVNFHEPTPLAEIVSYLEGISACSILIDRPALQGERLTGDSPAAMSVEKQPLAVALQELLDPLELACRVIDERMLQITTRKAVATRLELEFYPVAELLTDGTSGPGLAEQIKSRLSGSTWNDAGGPGVLHFDEPSKCLIVLQSQPVQVAIGRLLAEKRAIP